MFTKFSDLIITLFADTESEEGPEGPVTCLRDTGKTGQGPNAHSVPPVSKVPGPNYGAIQPPTSPYCIPGNRPWDCRVGAPQGHLLRAVPQQVRNLNKGEAHRLSHVHPGKLVAEPEQNLGALSTLALIDREPHRYDEDSELEHTKYIGQHEAWTSTSCSPCHQTVHLGILPDASNLHVVETLSLAELQTTAAPVSML